jgi:hypothetical protein
MPCRMPLTGDYNLEGALLALWPMGSPHQESRSPITRVARVARVARAKR